MIETTHRMIFLFIICYFLLSKVGGSITDAVAFASKTTPSSAAPFSSSFNQNNQRQLPAIKVDQKGNIYPIQVLKRQLANDLGLHLRDLRIVDPSFPSQIQATFTSRTKAILFCIENIKVVVQHNEALVFSPYQPEVEEFVPILQQQIVQANLDASDGNRFEHIVLEAALNVVCNNLLRRVRALSPAVSSALAGLRAESRGLDVIITQVDELLPLKNKIDELRKRVKEIKRAITDVLNNDDDLTMMHLGSQTKDSTSRSADESGAIGEIDSIDTMKLEMMFENYLNEIEWTASEVEEMNDEIANTEENVVLQLDLLRNRILRFELLLSLASFVVTCGTLVAGIFGMNLLSHFETSNYVFYAVTAFVAASMVGLYTVLSRYGRSEKLF